MVTLFDPINYASQKRTFDDVIEGIIRASFFSTLLCQVVKKRLHLKFIHKKAFRFI
jgi:hypothetical protein